MEKVKWSYYELNGEEATLYNANDEEVDTIYLEGLLDSFLEDSEMHEGE